MDKKELIEALRETGIVCHTNDESGARIFLTINDLEIFGDKKDVAERQRKLQIAQFCVIVIIAACLIVSTIWGVLSQDNDHYIARDGYIVKVSDGGSSVCLIPETTREDLVERLLEGTGKSLCK